MFAEVLTKRRVRRAGSGSWAVRTFINDHGDNWWHTCLEYRKGDTWPGGTDERISIDSTPWRLIAPVVRLGG